MTDDETLECIRRIGQAIAEGVDPTTILSVEIMLSFRDGTGARVQMQTVEIEGKESVWPIN